MKKFLIIFFAILLISLINYVSFADGENSYDTMVEYEGTGSEEFLVTVPAYLEPNSSGKVSISGTWSSMRMLEVETDSKIELVNSLNKNEKKDLLIDFDGIYLVGSNTDSLSLEKDISIGDIENVLFGTWSGVLVYNVSMKNNLNHNDGSELVTGQIYNYGDYTYKYGKYLNSDGWVVSLNEEVTDRNQTSYGEILESINGAPIVSLASTFKDCENLEVAPKVPESTIIMAYTFQNCTSLIETPIIPDTVQVMLGAFDQCTSLLTAHNLPANLSSNTNYSAIIFQNCTSLVNPPVIPEGITNLTSTFSGCTSLVNAPEIPSTVTNMSNTFSGCTSLVNASEIPPTVTNMISTFEGATSLVTAPSIPSSVTNLTKTFKDCTSLEGNVEINAEPTKYTSCFEGVDMSPITLTGTSSLKTEIRNTGILHTFSLYCPPNGTRTLEFAVGMTWQDWVNSSLGNSYAVVNGYIGIPNYDDSSRLDYYFEYNGSRVKGDEKIIEGATYERVYNG